MLLFPSKWSWEQNPDLLRHIWLFCLPNQTISFRRIFLNPLIILHCCCNKKIHATLFSSWPVNTSFFQKPELFHQELCQLWKSNFVSVRQLMWALKPLQDNALIMPVSMNCDHHVQLHHCSCIQKSCKEIPSIKGVKCYRNLLSLPSEEKHDLNNFTDCFVSQWKVVSDRC